MDLKEIAAKQIQDSIDTKKLVLETLVPEIVQAGKIASEVLEKGHTILFCGNGGSSCDASHIAAELVVRYKSGNERRALPAISLSADSAVLTACSNDYGYEDVFSRQVAAFGKKGDLLIGLSTSGNSKNVLSALEEAKKIGMKTISFLGGDGGKMKGLADLDIIIPKKETARIQESHILIGHILCSIIEQELFQLA
ncbi:D-sedoheptulose 7-phosphate isomerase [Leptospira wolffii]|uniref:Phosphoheptose isomerase n=1 Tax=Leptospira wolffii TaxID=409998 RepID=A0A2M9Z6U4_9LEPT|nr:D-sedoheptulose 7-phosphate isomerase [Leptospira wolffii]PJZ64146.1 phosphoheptose isomerase [Leptospira wolffii]TGK56864.1 D-sedoheptulose 7-phosphate isomerase [Leptospira wolffii]TGK71554.1 D-sedoheptulose 7-phosphate isomerase [Leptospira wolffii]TGK75590.1 D-sedoheptulose 7-phosphate isomerase [Leptospira wolffii]TGL32921.1 D-sedoheptulose 7-phosphate isomerase [Leptospira wolffii]